MKLKQIAKVAKALSDETRLHIYESIAKVEEANCGHICALEQVGGPSVSHHLRILSEAGLVDSRRQGQFIYYRARPEAIDEFTSQLIRFFPQHRK
ncbi:MAG TPA: metalloregulator ArsR/SmtB family transcription factor [Bryobacteraceae bacterium]|jgi:ArsR family transcriptional regulator